MSDTSYSKVFNAIVSTTMENYKSELADNIFDESVVLNQIKKDGGYKPFDGGTKLIEPLISGENSTAEAYGAYDQVDVTPQNNITSALYDPKYYTVSMVYSKQDKLQNSGKSAVINLVESKIKNAEASLKNLINQDMFTGNAANSKKILGLSQIIEATGEVGGLNPATAGQEFWASNEENTAEALTLARMDNMVTTLSRGSGKLYQPNIILTTGTLYDKFNSLLVANQRFADPKLAEAGFTSILHKGVPVVFDANCTSGVMYFINTKFLNLRYHKDDNFVMSPTLTPTDQHADIAHLTWTGALTTNNRKAQGKLTAKTA